jgi:Transglutaminase-like superfamily
MKGLSRIVARRLALIPKWNTIGDLMLFFAIFLFSAMVPLLMRVNIRRVGRWLEPRKPGPAPDPERVRQIVAYLDAAIGLGQPLIRPGCLTLGIARYFFLRRAGLDVSLLFGTGKPDDAFAAHCWLMRDGRPYLEKTPPEPMFQAIFRFPENIGNQRRAASLG